MLVDCLQYRCIKILGNIIPENDLDASMYASTNISTPICDCSFQYPWVKKFVELLLEIHHIKAKYFIALLCIQWQNMAKYTAYI